MRLFLFLTPFVPSKPLDHLSEKGTTHPRRRRSRCSQASEKAVINLLAMERDLVVVAERASDGSGVTGRSLEGSKSASGRDVLVRNSKKKHRDSSRLYEKKVTWLGFKAKDSQGDIYIYMHIHTHIYIYIHTLYMCVLWAW